jgi:Fe-S-cluster containining protein
MNPARLAIINEEGKAVIHLDILDSQANLQDVLDAWQPLCDDRTIYKTYARGHYDACRACTSNCCDAADVTPDLISFQKMAVTLKIDGLSLLQQYCDPVSRQEGLVRLKSGPCIFLHHKQCTIYPVRSLLCRFYICTELSASTQDLIYRVSLAGAAATQLFALEAGWLDEEVRPKTGFDLMFWNYMYQARQHPAVRAFLQAADYRDIPVVLLQNEINNACFAQA